MRRELGTGQLKTGQTAKVSTLKKNIQGVINWTQRFLKIICSIAMKNIFSDIGDICGMVIRYILDAKLC